jgi:hypothetical protein
VMLKPPIHKAFLSSGLLWNYRYPSGYTWVYNSHSEEAKALSQLHVMVIDGFMFLGQRTQVIPIKESLSRIACEEMRSSAPVLSDGENEGSAILIMLHL